MKVSKNKTIKILVAMVIIAGSVLSLGLKFFMDDAALKVDRPTFIKTSPDNNVALLVGNSIYFIDEFGETSRIFDFNKKGFRIRGDFDFFSNGDLLVYSNIAEPDTLEKLAQFARIKETSQDPDSGNDGLYRCNINTQDCHIFTTSLPAFHTTFRTVIDRDTDTVYISDTPRFALYKLDSTGALLAQNNSNLKFPNQILLHDNALYIANTNFHSVKVVRTDNQHFGEEIKNHETVIDSQHVWPTEVIATPDGWWVGIADNNIDNGRIQIFDNDWKKLGDSLFKGTDADTRSMALFGSEVWITDWKNIKVYRLSLSGERMSDFSNKEVDQAFMNSDQLIKKYKIISANALTAFFIVFGIGIVAAFVLEKEETLGLFKRQYNDFTENVDTEKLTVPPGEGVYWIENKFSKYRKILMFIVAVTIIFLIWSLSSIFASEIKTGVRLSIMLMSIIPVAVLIFWAWYRITIVRIGVSGELLLVDDGRGNVGKGKGGLIKYSKNNMVVDNVAVFLGQPHAPLFPAKELKKWVAPRMLLGEPVDQWYIFKILWKQKHPSAIAGTVFFLYLAIVLILIYH